MTLLEILNKIILILVLFFLTIHSYSQKKEKLSRHQVGINMGEFIPLFRTQSNNFDLNYRFKIDSSWALRTSISFENVSEDDGKLDLGTRLGFDRCIRTYNKFTIYTGLDFNYSNTTFNIDDRSTKSLGPSIFIGFLYQPVHFLSISTEPGLYFTHIIFKDPSSFSETRVTRNETSISNIGQLLLSFHF